MFMPRTTALQLWRTYMLLLVIRTVQNMGIIYNNLLSPAAQGPKLKLLVSQEIFLAVNYAR